MQDRASLEARVRGRVVGHHRHPVLNHLVGDGPRNLLELGVAEPALGDRRHELAGGLVPEQDRDAVHVHDLEGHVHDHAQQAVEFQLRGELLSGGEEQRQLLGLPLLRGGGGHLELAAAGGPVPAGDARRQAAAHLQLTDDVVAGGRLLEGRWCRLPRERSERPQPEHHFAERHRVVGPEPSGRDPAAVDARPVGAAEVADLHTVGLRGQLGVAARDRGIVDRDVARYSAPHHQAPAGRQLENLLSRGADEAVRGHGGKIAQALAARANASSTARAFASVSRNSERGSESATMPAPAWIQARPPRITQVRMAMAVSRVRAPQPT